MSDFRCKPSNLSMNESSPYGQKYAYGSEHSMKDMLDVSYFMSQRDRFRSGDEIRLTRHKTSDPRSRVMEFAEVLVVDAGLDLEFAVLREPTKSLSAKVKKPEVEKKAA